MAQEYLPRDYDVFLGIDVDKKKFSFTVKDHHSIISKSKTIPSQPQQLYNYVTKQFAGKKVLFAYEVGPTGYQLYDFLSAKKQDCLVVSPAAIPKASNQKVKNNRIDSQKIAEELKAGNLIPIRVPQGAYRELRHLVNLSLDFHRG